MAFITVLVNPNAPGSYRKARISTVNLGIAAISSYLEQEGYSSQLLDARNENLDPKEACFKLMNHKIDIIGISLCFENSVPWSSEFLKIFKNNHPETHITLGGYYPTLQTKKAFAYLNPDSIVLGEGEKTFLELLQKVEKRENWRNVSGIAYKNSEEMFINTTRPLIKNLDSLPWPKRYLMCGAGDNYEIIIEGSRGCVRCCSFCAVRPFFKPSVNETWRARSAVNIFEEIASLKKAYPNLKHFRFIDPDFIGPDESNRAYELANLIINNLNDIHFHIEARATSIIAREELLSLLKKAGLLRVNIGIESGSPDILKKLNKQTNVEDNIKAIDVLYKLGIDFSYGFMMVTPWTTENDIEKNVSLLKRIGKIEIYKLFNELNLIPGTMAYSMALREGKVTEKNAHGVCYYPALTPRIEKLRNIRKILEKEFPLFMEDLWKIYEDVRLSVKIENSSSGIYEKRSDKLFLDIFNYCWKEASNPDATDANISASCVSKFNDPVKEFIETLEADLPESIIKKIKTNDSIYFQS